MVLVGDDEQPSQMLIHGLNRQSGGVPRPDPGFGACCHGRRLRGRLSQAEDDVRERFRVHVTQWQLEGGERPAPRPTRPRRGHTVRHSPHSSRACEPPRGDRTIRRSGSSTESGVSWSPSAAATTRSRPTSHAAARSSASVLSRTSPVSQAASTAGSGAPAATEPGRGPIMAGGSPVQHTHRHLGGEQARPGRRERGRPADARPSSRSAACRSRCRQASAADGHRTSGSTRFRKAVDARMAYPRPYPRTHAGRTPATWSSRPETCPWPAASGIRSDGSPAAQPPRSLPSRPRARSAPRSSPASRPAGAAPGAA